MYINYSKRKMEQLHKEYMEAKYRYNAYRAEIVKEVMNKVGGCRALARLTGVNPATISRIVNMEIGCTNKTWNKIMEL